MIDPFTAPRAARRVVTVPASYALGATLGVLRHGGSDPTCRVVDRTWWLGQATLDGPSTLAIRGAMAGIAAVEAAAWGPGANWSLAHVEDLIGLRDSEDGFVAHHDVIARGRRQLSGWRIPKSRLVVQSLIPAILEQRVTGVEAFTAHTRLVRRFGSPAPGPGETLRLWVPPAPRDWARIPSWEWIEAGVDRARSETAVRASSYAGRLEECADLPLPQAHARLRALPGVGEWTAAEVAQRALGDSDSPSFGDYHMAKDLTWVLTGTVGDDDQARALLEPYAGHRYRAQTYALVAGGHRPRRGPRMTLPTHLPRGARSQGRR